MVEEIAVIGECMLEISSTTDSQKHQDNQLAASISYGGDSLNTAVYLSRQGISVDYVSALGDDRKSDWLLKQWQQEGIGCSLVKQVTGGVPGIYMIETDESGERFFHYWRDRSPANQLFKDTDALSSLFDKLINYRWIYLSGISLALFNDASKESLFTFLKTYRQSGGKVLFDSNYRPQLWSSRAQTMESYSKLYALTDIALPTYEDEQQLFKDDSQESCIARIQSYGVQEIVLKAGEEGCQVVCGDSISLVNAISVSAVDTTAAGDSFNAGYMAARMSGDTPIQSAKAGHRLASSVVQYRGAIIPISAMPKD